MGLLYTPGYPELILCLTPASDSFLFCLFLFQVVSLYFICVGAQKQADPERASQSGSARASGPHVPTCSGTHTRLEIKRCAQQIMPVLEMEKVAYLVRLVLEMEKFAHLV